MVSLFPDYLLALGKEIERRTPYLQDEEVETIYFGGGTPSLLQPDQILQICKQIKDKYRVSGQCEITLEGNPDDLTRTYLENLNLNTPVNRLSIGIQSFNNNILRLLNRRHNAVQAINCVRDAQDAGFHNISIDLIYGIPGMDNLEWERDLAKAFSLGIQHLSAYCLSYESGTSLYRKVTTGVLKESTDESVHEQFITLRKTADLHGFMHYEISNLALEGYFSKHNSNYWKQKKYLGLGPSAHSFDVLSRQWNVSNIKDYIRGVNGGYDFFEKEDLNDAKRYNEYLMVCFRTRWGVNIETLLNTFGGKALHAFRKDIEPFIASGHVIYDKSAYRLNEEGWFISDLIISKLMKV